MNNILGNNNVIEIRISKLNLKHMLVKTKQRPYGNTSAFLMSGSKCLFTKIYHKDSPARGRTYKASSPRLAFFSNKTERPDNEPANQYTSLWSFDATFLCKQMTAFCRPGKPINEAIKDSKTVKSMF